MRSRYVVYPQSSRELDDRVASYANSTRSVRTLSCRPQIAEENLKQSAQFHGVNPARLLFSNKTAWINHTLVKSAADLVLDTFVKNGHTSSADALWAGAPLVTLRGTRFGSKVASSLVSAMGVPELATHSVREYENLCGARAAASPQCGTTDSRVHAELCA